MHLYRVNYKNHDLQQFFLLTMVSILMLGGTRAQNHVLWYNFFYYKYVYTNLLQLQ